MVASALLAFVVLARQDPASVTVNIPALGAPAAVQKLADQTGQKLATGKGLEDEVIIINVKDVPLQTVLDRVAIVTEGKWEMREDVLTLLPDPAARKESRERAIQKSIAKLEKQIQALENPKPLSEEMFEGYEDEKSKEVARKYYLQEQNMQKLVAQLVRGIGLRNLATTPINQRTVYSDQPTQAQRRLNGPWAKFTPIVKEQYAGMQGYEEYDPMEGLGNEGMPPEALEMMRIQAAYNKMRQVFNGNPVKYLLIVNRYSADIDSEDMPAGITAQLMAMDDKGALQYVANFGGGGYMEDAASVAPSEVTAAGTTGGGGGAEQNPLPDNSPKLQFTKEELDLIGNPYGASGVSDQYRKNILKMFTNPEADPLDTAAGIVLRSWARADNANLIASLPDQAAALRWIFYSYSPMPGEASVTQQGTTVSAMRESVRYYPLIVESKDGWLTMAPTDRDNANNTRLGRAAAADLARSMEASMIAPLDVRAKFAFENPNAENNELASLLTAISIQGQSMYGYEPPAILRFWGSLTPGQRSQLKSQGRIGMNTLGANTREVLADVIYNIRHNLSMNPPEEVNNLPHEVKFMMGMGGGYGWDMSSWMTEPTEAFPRGIPMDGFVSLQGMKETCFIPTATPEQTSMFMPVLGATELMMIDVWKSLPAEQLGEWVPTVPARGKVAKRTNMAITIQLTPQVQMAGPLIDLEIDEARGEVSIQNPPDDIKQEMNSARTRMKTLEGWMKYMMGMWEGEGPIRKP